MKNKKIECMNRIEELEEIILELEEWDFSKELSFKAEKLVGKIVDFNQRDAMIKLLKDLKETTKLAKHANDDNKLYLTQIIEQENPEFGSNNLILSPVGSGKTTLIKDILIKDQTGKILMLVSNTTLKNAICPDDDELRKENGHRMYTTQNKKKYGEENYEIHVMSYAEFGNRIKINNDFVENVVQIYCDEIHSLPSYQQIEDSAGLSHAIKYLFDKHEDKQIFYFTATRENLDSLNSRHPDIFRHVKTFDYLSHPEIKQYMALSEYKINHLDQIRPHLKARLKSFNYFGYKGLAFSRTIAGQKKIERIALEEGFKPLILWSVNNEELQLNEEQIKAREYILKYCEIPSPYNLLIINSAMQEGWNLHDNSIKLAIMNTTKETEKVQALGRHRNDIDILLYRVNQKNSEDKLELNLKDNFLNTPLTVEDKEILCNELAIINSVGKLTKWRAIKTMLINQNYKVEDMTKVIDGKRTRISIITKL